MHRDRRSLDLVGREHRVHHPLLATMFGKVVHHENPRTANLDFRMHQPLAVLRRHPYHLGGAKRLLVELERRICIADDEMRGYDLNRIGHFLKLLSFVKHATMRTNEKVRSRQGAAKNSRRPRESGDPYVDGPRATRVFSTV